MVQKSTAESCGGPSSMQKTIRAAWRSKELLRRKQAFIDTYVASYCAALAAKHVAGHGRDVVRDAISEAEAVWALLLEESG